MRASLFCLHVLSGLLCLGTQQPLLQAAEDTATPEGAQAEYLRGRIAMLQRTRPGTMDREKQVLLDRAVIHLTESARIARKCRSDIWLEAALRDHMNLLFAEFRSRQWPATLSLAKDIASLANELIPLDQAQAHLVLGQLDFHQSAMQKAADHFAKGLETPKSKDKPTLQQLHTLRAMALMYSGDAKVFPDAAKHATEGVRLARDLKTSDLVGPDLKNAQAALAYAQATLGEVLFRSFNQDVNQQARMKLRNDSTIALRAALEDDTGHPNRWLWCHTLASLIDLKPNPIQADREEALKCIQEARAKVPPGVEWAAYRQNIDRLYDTFKSP